MEAPLKIILTLPYLFSVRDILYTPVWNEMINRKNVTFYLLASSVVGDSILSRNTDNIFWVQPPSFRGNKRFFILLKNPKLLLTGFFRYILDRYYLSNSEMYRFSAIHGLSHCNIRRNRSKSGKKRSQILMDYRGGELVGLPFPKSKLLFKIIRRFRQSSTWNLPLEAEKKLLKEINPDLFVHGRLQFGMSSYWISSLKRMGIPMVGYISSWDHPTTKGPLPSGMSGYIVASQRMKKELVELHGINEKKISVIGKVQMDIYNNRSKISVRQLFLKQLGIPENNRLITFGTNATGLKEHEVSIARKIAGDVVNGCYGKATLFIRTHPQDKDWKRDFLSLAKPPHVICFNACSFDDQVKDVIENGTEDMIFLANLMKHSDVVIQSRGSLALDAIAFDTPVISLAFDGDLERPWYDSFLLEYDFEHYKPIVEAQGTWMVGSFNALDQAIQEYLADPTIHSKGREKIRTEHIEPFDGQASKRFVDYIVSSAQNARKNKLPTGDWNLTGIGDVTWAERQKCKALNYIHK